jgi:hypothetical protein
MLMNEASVLALLCSPNRWLWTTLVSCLLRRHHGLATSVDGLLAHHLTIFLHQSMVGLDSGKAVLWDRAPPCQACSSP